MLPATLTIPRRFCGPSNSGNGGYVCGRVARFISGAAKVRLFLPPPLETELNLIAVNDALQLRHNDTLVAEACHTEHELNVPAAVTFSEAQQASQSYSGFIKHNFPDCFVCGPERQRGDGMRIFAGPLPNRAMVAAPWIADASLINDGGVADEFLWAALDCPGAFALLPVQAGMTLVLGQLSVRIAGRVSEGEKCVVIGWPLRIEGRKRIAGSAIFSEQGSTIATGIATWIEVAENAFS